MDVAMVEQFGMLYTNGWKPKKIMQELGIDYATYRKLFKEWKRQKEKEKYTTKEEDRKEKDQEKDTEEEYQEENDQEDEEPEEEQEYQEPEENQEKESYNESNEEEYYRDDESQEEGKNQSINQVRDDIINKELEDFFEDDGELKVVREQESEDDDEDDDEQDIEEIVGDARETILFFVCLWLFLLAVKYPGDMMEKLDFVNSFIEKRERQIKRMVEKIDNVLRNYTKLYNMLAKANDWTFLMDMAILTLTFKSELEENFLLQHKEEKKDNKKETAEYIELKEEQNSFGGRLSLLLGGEGYVESIQQ